MKKVWKGNDVMYLLSFSINSTLYDKNWIASKECAQIADTIDRSTG